jgi:hypothetical protein
MQHADRGRQTESKYRDWRSKERQRQKKTWKGREPEELY